MIGALGGVGGVLIVKLTDISEIHPAALVTLKLYVPGARFGRTVPAPVPAIEPGFSIQTPVAGNPLIATLPVVAVHDAGWVIVLITGAEGAAGAGSITTVVDGNEIHPASVVTKKLYVPGFRNDMVAVVPVPVIPPGLIVQVPVAGRPVSTTLPVGFVHEAGCVTVPTTGGSGPEGAAIMTTRVDVKDIHPAALVTEKSYVPGSRSVIVAVVPVPAIAPGLMVQTPVAGRPVSTTVPVEAAHDEGWVIEPTIGAAGAEGGGFMTISADACEIQPGAPVTLKL